MLNQFLSINFNLAIEPNFYKEKIGFRRMIHLPLSTDMVSLSWTVMVHCLELFVEILERWSQSSQWICPRSTDVVVSLPFVLHVFVLKKDTIT